MITLLSVGTFEVLVNDPGFPLLRHLPFIISAVVLRYLWYSLHQAGTLFQKAASFCLAASNIGQWVFRIVLCKNGTVDSTSNHSCFQSKRTESKLQRRCKSYLMWTALETIIIETLYSILMLFNKVKWSAIDVYDSFLSCPTATVTRCIQRLENRSYLS